MRKKNESKSAKSWKYKKKDSKEEKKIWNETFFEYVRKIRSQNFSLVKLNLTCKKIMSSKFKPS